MSSRRPSLWPPARSLLPGPAWDSGTGTSQPCPPHMAAAKPNHPAVPMGTLWDRTAASLPRCPWGWTGQDTKLSTLEWGLHLPEGPTAASVPAGPHGVLGGHHKPHEQVRAGSCQRISCMGTPDPLRPAWPRFPRPLPAPVPRGQPRLTVRRAVSSPLLAAASFLLHCEGGVPSLPPPGSCWLLISGLRGLPPGVSPGSSPAPAG